MKNSYFSRVRSNFGRLAGLPLHRRLYYLANTIVGETFRSRTFGTLGFRLIEISLTDRCQCRCVHCCAATAEPLPEREELTTSEVHSIIDQASAMRATEVCFSGGEPLLRCDIVDLVRHARRKGLVSKIVTNGILLSEALVAQLKEAGLNWCAVSLDSPWPNEHDALRKHGGCFDLAVKGLKRLIQYGIPASISTYARKAAIHSGDLEKIVELGRGLKVATVRINFPVPVGRLEDSEDEILTLDEREEVRKLLRYGIVSMESPAEETSCTSGITKINVLPNGDVTPCVFVPLPCGNVHRQTLRDIWQAMGNLNGANKPKGRCPMCDPDFRAKLRANSLAGASRGCAPGGGH